MQECTADVHSAEHNVEGAAHSVDSKAGCSLNSIEHMVERCQAAGIEMQEPVKAGRRVQQSYIKWGYRSEGWCMRVDANTYSCFQ
jgi:hypothetical protein